MAHKIWKVKVGSRQDGPCRVFELPVRAVYLVESKFRNGLTTIERKALALAAEDGISGAVVLGAEWINPPDSMAHLLRPDDLDF